MAVRLGGRSVPLDERLLALGTLGARLELDVVFPSAPMTRYAENFRRVRWETKPRSRSVFFCVSSLSTCVRSISCSRIFLPIFILQVGASPNVFSQGIRHQASQHATAADGTFPDRLLLLDVGASCHRHSPAHCRRRIRSRPRRSIQRRGKRPARLAAETLQRPDQFFSRAALWLRAARATDPPPPCAA